MGGAITPLVRGQAPQAKRMPTRVSVILANYNGRAFVADAIASACQQTLRDIEILVVDDASTDDSVAIITGLMQRDSRIRLLTSDCNLGPAASRNRALRVAAGEWIAVLDNDDLMHPERLSCLIAAGVKDQADIVADDLLVFDGGHTSPRTILRGQRARAPFWLDIETYVRGNALLGRGAALGYLKPIFRASLLKSTGIFYDERLRIAEDFDFVFRLLERGVRFRVYPWLTYFYRKHSASISHRLSDRAIESIKLVDKEARVRCAGSNRRVRAALEARTRSIDRALAFDSLVEAIKRRDFLRVFRIALSTPRACLLLRFPILARLSMPRRLNLARGTQDRRQVCV